MNPLIQLKKTTPPFAIALFLACFALASAAYAQGITWTPANPMNKARAFFVAVELLNGNVLVAGGYDGILDPRTGTWSDAGSMTDPRAGHSAVVLNGNRGVLVMGGLNAPPAATASVDIAVETH